MMPQTWTRSPREQPVQQHAPAVGLVGNILHVQRAAVPGELVGILERLLRLPHILKLQVTEGQQGCLWWNARCSLGDQLQIKHRLQAKAGLVPCLQADSACTAHEKCLLDRSVCKSVAGRDLQLRTEDIEPLCRLYLNERKLPLDLQQRVHNDSNGQAQAVG
jgi:hypothetical protein